MISKKTISCERICTRSSSSRKIIFTRDNIRIDREIIFEDDIAYLYIEIWFDVEHMFDIQLLDDDILNLYACISMSSGEIQATYTLYRADCDCYSTFEITDLSEVEKNTILELADEVSLMETGMTVRELWLSLEDDK